MARVKVNPILLLSILDPTCQHGLIRQALILDKLGKSTLAICASVANQNDVEIDNITWLSYEEIKRQLDSIGRRYWVDWAIVSGVYDLNLASALIQHLSRSRPGIKILWQPTLQHPEQLSHSYLSNQEEETFWLLCKNIHTVFLSKSDQTLFSQPIRLKDKEWQGCNVYLQGTTTRTNGWTSILYSKGVEYELESVAGLDEDVRFVPTLTSYLYEGLELRDALRQTHLFLPDKSH